MGELDEKLNSILSNPDSMAQIMQMAQQLSGSFNQQPDPPSPPPQQQSQQPQQQPSKPADGGSFLGGLDPGLAAKFLPLLQEYSKPNTQAIQLLNALRPYLKEEKQEKIQRAAKLARIIHLGKKFLMEWEG